MAKADNPAKTLHGQSNGLPVHQIAIPGTRATTILVAFDAGSRTESAEENGISHFLEHLVFKGGQIYDDYSKVHQTADRMGGSLNAYTSHDLVAFQITVRAELASPAIDLLTDFVARPQLDGDQIDMERGVVIQEIQQYKDDPDSAADILIDQAGFGDHPLGRPVLGPQKHIESFTRQVIIAFRDRRWSGQRGGAFIVGNLDHLSNNGSVEEAFDRFPSLPAPPSVEAPVSFSPQILVEERDSNQSHLRILYQPQINPADLAQRAAF